MSIWQRLFRDVRKSRSCVELPRTQSTRHRPTPERRRGYHPRLEALEDRALPSTVTWINPAGGAWETASNWSTGGLPGPADDVVISNLNSNVVITHASDTTSIHSLTVSTTQGSISLSGGSLTLGSSSTINDALNFSSGTITGPGDLTVTAPFTWTGGTIAGMGAVNANAGLTLSGSSTRVLDGRTLTSGTTTWSGTGGILAGDAAVFNNTGTFTVQNTPPPEAINQTFAWSSSGAMPTFNNSGTFTRSGTDTGTTTFSNVAFNNSNTVQVQSGRLLLSGGGASSGSFTAGAGAILEFGAGHNLTPSSSVAGAGSVVFSSGSTDVRGAYNVTGATTFSGAGVSFPGALTSVGSTLTISGGTADFERNNVSVSTATLSGSGQLRGTGTLTTTTMTWTGGTMGDTGTTTIPAGGSLTISGTGTKFLDGRTVNSDNTTWSDTGGIVAGDGAVFNNTHTFTVQNATATNQTFGWSGVGAPAVFVNGDTFTRAGADTGTTTFSFTAFNNFNFVDVQTGTLTLAGGGFAFNPNGVGATLFARAGATLNFGGGNYLVTVDAGVGGAGNVVFSAGSVEVQSGGFSFSNYNVTGSTTVSGASVSFPGVVTSVGSSLTVSGGTVNFVNNAVSVASATISGGTLLGLRDLAVTNLTWTGGTMGDTGSTTVSGAAATLTISGTGQKTLDSRTLNIFSAGSANWTGGALLGSNGAVINNSATVFNVQTDQPMFWSSGATPAFNNFQGTFQKSAGTGTTAVSWVFTNDGTLDVQQGTLAFAQGGTSLSDVPVTTLTVESGALLRFDGGTFSVGTTASVTGAGAVEFRGGTVEVTGTYNVTGATTFSGANVSFPGPVTTVGSTLTLSGGTANFERNNVTTTTGTISGGTLLGTGNVQFTFLTWSGGTMGDTGTTTVGAPGALAINGTGQKTLDRRTLNLPGTTTDWNGGTIVGSNGAVINNSGFTSTFAVHTGQSLFWSSGATPVFNNAGPFVKNDSGVTTISWQFNNSSAGFAEVDNGTLTLTGGGTSQGNFTSNLTIGSAGSTLTFGGGTYNLTPSSSITGFNAVQFTGGNVEMAGTYNVNGTPAQTAVSGGTVDFVGTTTAIGSTLTVSGGEADFVSPIGSGPVALSALTLSGGTLNLFANAVTTPTFTMSGGALLGTADVGATALTWTGGTMGDTGSTTVAANGTLSISGSGQKTLNSRTLNVSSGVTGPNTPPDPIWTGGTIIGSNGAVLNNMTTFDTSVDQSLFWSSGDAPVFNNFGAFRKLAGTVATTVSWVFNNINNNTDGQTPGGVVNVQSGSLVLSNSGTSQGSDASDPSSFTVAAGTLAFAGGEYSLGSNSSVTGAGAVDFRGGTVEAAGTYNVTGSTTVSSAAVAFPGTVAGLGSALTLSGGTADFEANNVTVPTATFSGGTLLGVGNVTVINNATWSGTAMRDTGQTIISGTLTISGTSQKVLDARTLNIVNGATWTGGTIFGSNGASIIVQPGATFSVQTDQQLFWSSGAAPTFFNGGTFRKSITGGTTTVSWVFDNTRRVSTVDLQTGTLAFSFGGSSDGDALGSATFSAATGTTLRFDGGTYSHGAHSQITGAGNVVFGGGSVEVAGTYNITGSTTVSGSSVSFPGSVTSVGSSLTISAGIANFEGNTFTTTTGTISGGTLLGTGGDAGTVGLFITNLTWTGGTMADNGSISVGSLTISGTATKTLDTRTLNTGSVSWTGGTITGNNGAVINNAGTFLVQTDQPLFWSVGAAPVFNNSGTFRKSGPTGVTSVTWVFNNSGTVDEQTGTLNLIEGGTSQADVGSTASFTVGAGGTLGFAGGHALGTRSQVTGAGTVTFIGGNIEVAGTYNLTGSTTVSNAQVAFPGTLSSAGSSLTISGGSVNFENNAVTTTTGTFSGGTLLGTADVRVTNLTWSGTTMADTGSTTVPAGGTLTVSGNATKTLDTRTLNINSGVLSATWTGGAITGNNGATINNSATFDAQTDQPLFWFAGATPVFNNAGTFRKSAGAATSSTTGNWLFNNSGTVDVHAGRLFLAGGGTAAGSFTVAAGTTLGFEGGTYSLGSGSSVAGAGTVSFDAGTVFVAGGYGTTGTTNVGSSGTVEFLANAGTAALANVGTVIVADGVTLTVTGTYNQTAFGVTDLFGGTLSASTVSVGANSSFFGLGTVNGNFTNAGTLSLGFGNSTGILNINGNYTQTSTGTLAIKVGGTSTGTQFDQLAVTGTATLAGTLSGRLINSFGPPFSLAFLRATGGVSNMFSTVSLPGGSLIYHSGDVTWQF
jgi:hypothetical protein